MGGNKQVTHIFLVTLNALHKFLTLNMLKSNKKIKKKNVECVTQKGYIEV